MTQKSKHREEAEILSLTNRLKRIEGQVRGVQRLVNEEAYCTDIITQVSAIKSALNAFNQELLSNHINTCVVNKIKNGDDEIIEELTRTVKKLMR